MTLNEKVKNADLTQNHIKQSIKTMRELIVVYQTNNKVDECPLCRLNPTCQKCPWKILKGKDVKCTLMVSFRAWGEVPQRIRQLRHWIKAYEDNLNK